MVNKLGEEVPDPEPIAVPAGFKVPETMEQMMRRLLRSPEFQRVAHEHEVDTFEEAEDFDVDDDTFDPKSPYEAVFDPVLGRDITHEEFVKHRDVYEKRYMEAFDKLHNSDALRARFKPDAPVSPPPEGEGTEGEGEDPSKK